MNKTSTDQKKVISYSQFSNWYKCPQRWKLDCIDGKKLFEDSIQMIFGEAIHRTLQLYLKTLYTKGLEKAESINKERYFKHMFAVLLKQRKFEHTQADFLEYVTDAENILREFSSNAKRTKHFPTDKFEFVDVEHEILVDIMNNVKMIAYLDLVLKDKSTGKIKIIDIKTSSTGWNSYMKEDESKTAQLIMYKALYSKKYNIPLNKIDIEFFIVKRRLYEGVQYKQDRIQVFVPRHTEPEVMKTIGLFIDFVSECFTKDGQYNTEKKYLKIPGKNKKNCKYCPHLKVNCDGFADAIEE